MAIYRFEAQIIGRSDNALGRSVVACAAYRSASNLRDEKYETRYDYSRRKAGVDYTDILTPDNTPAWASDREALWNTVERKEDESTRRKQAQLAREYLPALPRELTREQRRELVLQFAREELVARGMIADVAIHEPKQGDNYHAHILCTMREVGQAGFGKKVREWNDTKLLVDLREAWENHTNAALEAAGRPERVDRRSLADRGIEREAQPKQGPASAALERKGIETEKGRAVRDTNYVNQVRDAIHDVVTHGEVTQHGMGDSWWERLWEATLDGMDATITQVMALLRDDTSGGCWREREEARSAHREPGMEMDAS